MLPGFLREDQAVNIPKFCNRRSNWYDFIYIRTKNSIEMVPKSYENAVKEFTPAPTYLQFIEMANGYLNKQNWGGLVASMVKQHKGDNIIDDICEQLGEIESNFAEKGAAKKEVRPERPGGPDVIAGLQEAMDRQRAGGLINTGRRTASNRPFNPDSLDEVL